MSIGEARHPMTIQQETPGRTATGGMTQEWSTFAETMGSFTAASGREAPTGGQKFHHNLTGRVKCRWIPGVTAGMRILFKGTRILFIRSVVNEDERNVWLLLGVEEGGE